MTIPNSVISIGVSAFYGCSGLTNMTIPDNVTSIGACAFYGCMGLTNVTIPDGVTSIDYCTFLGCSGLTSVTIPDSITSIDDFAFEDCSGLTSVTIPDSVTEIGYSAFDGCTGLTSAGPIGGGYSYEFGWTDKIPSNAFSDCTSLASVTIPNSVTSIGENAFYGCIGLASVTIPDSVTEIGKGAFYHCTGLTGVMIPDSVTEIGERAFDGCTGLASVTISDSVTEISGGAFSGCTGLTSVTIPDSVTSIGQYAFSGCTGLTDVYYKGSKTQWNAISISSGNEPLTRATIHYNSTGPEAFGKCGPSATWVLENGVLTISGSGFMNDFRFHKVSEDLPPWYALRERIEKVVINEGITTIGKNAFYGCSKLTTVNLPQSLTAVGEAAFSGCDSLKDSYYNNSKEDWETKIQIAPSNETFVKSLYVPTTGSGYSVQLLENTATSTALSLINHTESTASVRFVAAAYDENGKMVAIKTVDKTLAASEKLDLTVSYPENLNVRTVKAFVLSSSTSVPLRGCWSKQVSG